MSEFVLKGFPTEISEYIELPDIAELLLYPPFFDMDIEEAYKIGTEFQRYIIDKMPLRNKYKHISFLFQVRLLVPNTRSCTTFCGDIRKEWHIDSELSENNIDERIYREETDCVHLLSNNVTCLTEFNEKEIKLDIPENMTYLQFKEYLLNNWDEINVKNKKMEPNKITTFTNHMHRATNPEHPEFRLMIRAVETNRERKPLKYFHPGQNTIQAYDYEKKSFYNHIVKENGRIIINLPSQINNNMLWKNI